RLPRTREVARPYAPRLPDVAPPPRQWLAVGRPHPAVNQDRLTGSVAGDALPRGEFRRTAAVERPEQARFGRLPAPAAVLHDIDQRAESAGVGAQDKLLALLVSHVAGRGEEIDPRFPFLGRERDLARELVKVLE